MINHDKSIKSKYIKYMYMYIDRYIYIYMYVYMIQQLLGMEKMKPNLCTYMYTYMYIYIYVWQYAHIDWYKTCSHGTSKHRPRSARSRVATRHAYRRSWLRGVLDKESSRVSWRSKGDLWTCICGHEWYITIYVTIFEIWSGHVDITIFIYLHIYIYISFI